ncbi:3-oxoacyl-ACP reductase FabG [Rubrobacter taiwanensis]|jgi:3-oxoacyl-[acyl-carrier protein] reductase|uniref:3-oxoacyl-ACP reductase FabG n=1 Tax=Rubrobacter taiwanensis TaxID=185139 RepID=A0A4R1BQW1_9ACTN|nr:3-oxoacyl-ACP reductase family protein [Rubrobacter taiwanensis]TCJ19676.1 3-oxoacyl-ACP reductase FabG [Rubrobacter taiwanensis]
MIFSEGTVVWVTGSSTGIGRAAAIGFAREGCAVAVHYNSSEGPAQEVAGEIESLGREALLVRGDVSKAADVRRMVGEIERRFGRLDVLVNNAGALIERTTLSEMSEELWDRVMAVNLKSVFLCSQAALPLLRRSERARIINVTSIAARNGGGPGSMAYATAKGGVSTLTRAMAKELVGEGILVNAVAPGVIQTPFHERYTPPEVMEKLVSAIPIGRAGTPEETVGAMLFLASERANYVVGEVIEVNGGLLMD